MIAAFTLFAVIGAIVVFIGGLAVVMFALIAVINAVFGTCDMPWSDRHHRGKRTGVRNIL